MESDLESEILGSGVECAAAGGAGTQNLGTGGFGCKFLGFQTAYDTSISGLGVIGQGVVDFGNRFETVKSHIRIAAVRGEPE